ncbi:hypothetical protein [Flavobacterium frigoris]|uniref:Uncharacterized protein n=1 Tax=Flavobacterium frigoris TaxID=229204 RepID=A0A1H9S2V5_FLAFI|nr:hypothetical protein [Flavobacterium frigoris]SER79350.1 hypothetical protein SAMN05444355_1401 [Flavobacterium frigoris]
MIKEIFDIEPIQKNSLIMFFAISCLSFLQLFIFKRNVIEENSLLAICLSLGVSICWIISQMISYYLYADYTNNKYDEKNYLDELLYDKIALHFGFSLYFWMIVITYISFELGLTLIEFLRFSILVMFLKTIFWAIFSFRKYQKHQKLNKK